MRDLGITMIGLGLVAMAGSWFAPAPWQLDRWGMALLMLGTPVFMAHMWIEHRRERFQPPTQPPPADPR